MSKSLVEQIQKKYLGDIDPVVESQLDMLAKRLEQFKNKNRDAFDTRITKGKTVLRCLIVARHEYVVYEFLLLNISGQWTCMLEVMDPGGESCEEVTEFAGTNLSFEDCRDHLEKMFAYIAKN